MNYRQAVKADLSVIQSLLVNHQLPADDIANHLEHFIVIEQDNAIIGVGGLELCSNTVALLRSVVVKSTHRHQGIATNTVHLLMDKASALGIQSIYILTESAVNYFAQLKFTIQDRSTTPLAIQETQQFSQLCPTSATVMVKEITTI